MLLKIIERHSVTIRMLLIIFILIMAYLNKIYPTFRFAQDTYWNEVFSILILAFLPVLSINAFFIVNKYIKWISIFIYSLLSMISIVLIFALYTDIIQRNKDGFKISFVPLEKISKNNGYVVAYHLGQGVFGKSYIVVRREKEVLPNIFLVKNIFTYEGAEIASLEKDDLGEIVVKIYAWGEPDLPIKEVRLR